MHIHITPLPSPAELERIWLLLGASAPHSFFLSWHWIGTWLHCIREKISPMLLTASSGQKIIAAGIMVKTTNWRHNVMPIRTWILNATGTPELDSIYIEHNGLLAEGGSESAVWESVLEHLSTVESDWDEIRIDGAPPWLAEAWSARQMPIRFRRQSPSRFVDLQIVRSSPTGSCIETLPSRARTRIRHTINSITARHGPISVLAATDASQAHQYFSAMKELHEIRWADSANGSAFKTPFFETFHRELIDRHFDSGVLQLVRIAAGSTTLGYVYNFAHQHQVSFYQSGIDYSQAVSGESIGLLIHSLLIDYNARAGHERYDLLAGDSQYKRTLAPQKYDLWWGELQNQRLKLRIEDSARRVFRSFRKSDSLS